MSLPLQCKNKNNGSLAQLNRASDYGSEGYRFESCRSHFLDLFPNRKRFYIFRIHTKHTILYDKNITNTWHIAAKSVYTLIAVTNR